MIGGLLVLAFVWTSAYAVGRSSRGRRRRDHQPRLLKMLPPATSASAPHNRPLLDRLAKRRTPGFLNPGAALHNATRHIGELEIGRSRNRAIKIGCTGGLTDDRCWTGSDGTIHHGVDCRAAYECDEVAEAVGRVLDRALPKV